MKRLSGYYRRSIRLVLVVLAIVVTLVANIDALAVTEGLWRNPDGRSALIAQADALAAGEPIEAGDAVEAATLARLQQECRDLAPVAGSPDPDPADVAAGIQRVRPCVDDALSELSGLGVDRPLAADQPRPLARRLLAGVRVGRRRPRRLAAAPPRHRGHRRSPSCSGHRSGSTSSSA